MQENLEATYSEYTEPTNYIQSIIFALLGGLIGVGAWLIPVYFFEYILYITVILVGICAGFGARGFDRKKGNIGIAIIAILATIICIIIGDIAETGIAFGSFDITPETYFEYLEFKFGEDPQQLFYYLAAIVIAGYFGYTTLNKD